MRTVAHISDLHFGRIDPAIVEALLADLAEAPPNVIVVSGDLTQRARRHQFAAARAFLDRLPSPYLVVPGNHDVTPLYKPVRRFARPFSRYRRYILDDLCPTWCDDAIAVVGINTARPWRRKEGSISEAQIERVRRTLATVDERLFRVVVTHHPFLPPPDSPDTGLVGRAGLALRTFEACSVDLLLAGHLHRAYHGDVTTHHAAIKRSILVAQASTATSTRVRAEPNAYNWISIDGPTLRLHSRTWDGRRFSRADGETFRRIETRWVQVRGDPVPVA